MIHPDSESARMPASSLLDEPDHLGPSMAPVSVWRIANIALRYRWLIMGSSVGMAVAAVLLGLFQERTFSASASFMPVSRSGSSAISSLAAQFGLAGPSGDVSQSPQFYIDLARTRTILGNVVHANYHSVYKGQPVEGDYVTLLRIDKGSSAARTAAAVEHLAGLTHLSATPKTGVITLTVTETNGELAVQLANRILAELNDFNKLRRQSQAGIERKFTEQRLSEVGAELRSAEDQTQQFLQRNREYRNSPQLVFEYDRLSRLLAMRQQLYTALAQSYEQSKVEEIRDSPVLTIIEPPLVPLKPNPRGLRSALITWLFLGALAGIFASWLLTYFRGQRDRQADDYQEFVRLRAKLLNEVRHPLRALGKDRGRSA